MGKKTVSPAGSPPSLPLWPMREPLSSLSEIFAYLVDICTIPDLVRPGSNQASVGIRKRTAQAIIVLWPFDVEMSLASVSTPVATTILALCDTNGGKLDACQRSSHIIQHNGTPACLDLTQRYGVHSDSPFYTDSLRAFGMLAMACP